MTKFDQSRAAGEQYARDRAKVPQMRGCCYDEQVVIYSNDKEKTLHCPYCKQLFVVVREIKR